MFCGISHNQTKSSEIGKWRNLLHWVCKTETQSSDDLTKSSEIGKLRHFLHWVDAFSLAVAFSVLENRLPVYLIVRYFFGVITIFTVTVAMHLTVPVCFHTVCLIIVRSIQVEVTFANAISQLSASVCSIWSFRKFSDVRRRGRAGRVW